MSADTLEWRTLPAGLQAEFVSRMTERLPDLDPEAEWTAMSVQGRHDLRWFLEHTPPARHDYWAEECERLKAAADEETAECFRQLAEIERGWS